MGTPSLSIGGHDITKVLKVAAYVALSAFLTSVGGQLSGLDFSSVDLYGINGQVIATAVVNTLLYLGERFVRDTE